MQQKLLQLMLMYVRVNNIRIYVHAQKCLSVHVSVTLLTHGLFIV